MPLALQHRAGLRLTDADIDERPGATPIYQRPQCFEFCIPHLGLAPQHLKPTLENRAKARELPAVDERTRIGILVIRQ
jgi:hypothetical protein